jgi:hypothetical protein
MSTYQNKVVIKRPPSENCDIALISGDQRSERLSSPCQHTTVEPVKTKSPSRRAAMPTTSSDMQGLV